MATTKKTNKMNGKNKTELNQDVRNQPAGLDNEKDIGVDNQTIDKPDMQTDIDANNGVAQTGLTNPVDQDRF